MTTVEYKTNHHKALKEFLATEAGRNLIPVLHQLRPQFSMNAQPHTHIESAGAVRGYELCEKNVLFLSNPPLPNEEIEATYGVNEKK